MTSSCSLPRLRFLLLPLRPPPPPLRSVVFPHSCSSSPSPPSTIFKLSVARVFTSLGDLPTRNRHLDARFRWMFSSSSSESDEQQQQGKEDTSTSEGEQQQQQSPENGGFSKNSGPLKPGLYLVATPIGNLEDITLRGLRILRSADVILSEDTRHSGKLLQYYNIKTPLLSFHKFNESQREATILRRLRQGDIVALISDAGTPGISDPGMELAKSCVSENIPVIPIPGPSALVTALSASGLSTDEFTFVGFLPKHAGSRRERLIVSANEKVTQMFFVPPHKLLQFLNEACSIFGDSRSCVIAREMTKIHEEFWRGTLGEAYETFSRHQPKGEITLLIEGKAYSPPEIPSEIQLEHELREFISNGHSLSTAVKLVAEGTSAKRKQVYALALRIFGKQIEVEDSSGT